MLNRRRFLQSSSLLSLSPWVPVFVSQTAQAAAPAHDERMLVVIELGGGNDGLNTVVPFADEQYAKHRPTLQIPQQDVLRLNDAIGLHPVLAPAKELFDDGRLSIVQGVGYPNPNRSHFRSMAIWHSAHLQASRHNGQGWLGHAMDANWKDKATPAAVYVGDGDIPAAIVGRKSNAISLNDEADIQLASNLHGPAVTKIDAAGGGDQNGSATNDLTAFIQTTVDTSFQTAQRFAESGRLQHSTAQYPTSQLGQRLKLLANLLRLSEGTRVFYVSQPGYDTHSGQSFRHRNRLREFAGALKAFLDDLKHDGLSERTVVMAFSEFGRRVEENASAGTDHGTAGPLFIAGDSVQPGLLGSSPSLADLDNGDLKMSIDFRSVYAALLQDWLQCDSQPVLGGTFEPLSLFKTKAEKPAE